MSQLKTTVLIALAFTISLGLISFYNSEMEDVSTEYIVDLNECSSDTIGKKLFIENCASCHNISMNKVGPPLRHIESYRDRDWLIEFTKSPKNMMEKGDELALCVIAYFDDVYGLMVPSLLSDEEINLIYDYIAFESKSLPKPEFEKDDYEVMCLDPILRDSIIKAENGEFRR